MRDSRRLPRRGRSPSPLELRGYGKTSGRHRLRRCRRLFAHDGQRRGRHPCRLQGPSRRDPSHHPQSRRPRREEHRRRLPARVPLHRRRHRGCDRDADRDGRAQPPSAGGPRHAVPARRPHGRRHRRRGRGVRRRRQHRRPAGIGGEPGRLRHLGQGLSRGEQAPLGAADRCRQPSLQEHQGCDRGLYLDARGRAGACPRAP